MRSSRPTAALLQDAAVLGQVFSTDALAAVHRLPPTISSLGCAASSDASCSKSSRPGSPERGQHKFVQSLIREVAYGTLARRDRRSRHLAAARHFEALGDDALAGALASHYLAARDASDEGPEADAVAARHAWLFRRGRPAAALGGHDQAVGYLDQALAITTDPADRAPLLDRAAESASAAARDSSGYATEAIAAYREVGDEVAAAADRSPRQGAPRRQRGRARHGSAGGGRAGRRVHRGRAVLAETLAHLARAHMRIGPGESVTVADRALGIAERLNLDGVVAEAFVNKASSLNGLGRRRESIALHEAALALAIQLPDRGFQMRVRATSHKRSRTTRPRVYADAAGAVELARNVGDRSMYNFLVGSVAVSLADGGMTGMPTSLSCAKRSRRRGSPSDRIRLRSLMGLFEGPRGDRLDEAVADVAELVGDSTDPDDLFALGMAKCTVSLMGGDLRRATTSRSR